MPDDITDQPGLRGAPTLIVFDESNQVKVEWEEVSLAALGLRATILRAGKPIRPAGYHQRETDES